MSENSMRRMVSMSAAMMRLDPGPHVVEIEAYDAGDEVILFPDHGPYRDERNRYQRRVNYRGGGTGKKSGKKGRSKDARAARRKTKQARK